MYTGRTISRASALAVVILVASSALAEEFPADDASPGKHSPLGFGSVQPVKTLASSENEDFVKRAPMGFQGMRGKKAEARREIMENSLSELEEFEKRAPTSFRATRGKKEYPTADIAGPYFVDEYLKRAPMGFQGMRGKKAMAEEDYFKRAAMGFQGMRGKKSLELLNDELARYGENGGEIDNFFDYPGGEYEKRAPSMGFQGMRGKRDEFEDELSKRAPMGFQGTRGKKSFLREINDLEKRAMTGFQGTRGKKSTSGFDYRGSRAKRSIEEESSLTGNEKRLDIGFIGSRGKRSLLPAPDDYSELSTYELRDALADELAEDPFLRDALAGRVNLLPLQFDKRSAYGYSGAGTRGKKIPRWEIRGKFVGVRGKKAEFSPNNVHRNNERIGVADSTTILDIQ